MSCDAILQQGIFDTIVINSNRSLSANFLEWLSSASYSDFKQKLDAGLKIGLPIKNIPVEIKGDHSSDEFESWKQQYAGGNSRAFTEQETLQIVSSSVSNTLTEKWLECYRITWGQGRSGLVSSIESGFGQDTAVFTARYLPTSMDDSPPAVVSFQISGATTDYPLVAGQQVPLAGVSVLLNRQGEKNIVVVLNTSKGTVAEHSDLPPLRSSQMGLSVTYEPFHTPAGGDAGETFSLSITGPTRGLDQIEAVTYALNHKNLEITGHFPHLSMKWVPHTLSISSSDPASRFFVKAQEVVVHQIIASVKLRNGELWQYDWKFPNR